MLEDSLLDTLNTKFHGMDVKVKISEAEVEDVDENMLSSYE